MHKEDIFGIQKMIKSTRSAELLYFDVTLNLGTMKGFNEFLFFLT